MGPQKILKKKKWKRGGMRKTTLKKKNGASSSKQEGKLLYLGGVVKNLGKVFLICEMCVELFSFLFTQNFYLGLVL